MAYIYNGPELFLSHDFFSSGGIYPQKEHDAAGKEIDDKDHRSHDRHKKSNDPDITHRYLFCVYSGIVFRRDLSENEDRDCKHCRSNADHISAECICKCG